MRSISVVSNVIYYGLCVGWTVACLVKSSFMLRMGKFALTAIQTAFFVFCLLRIRSVMNEVAKQQSRESMRSSPFGQGILFALLFSYLTAIVFLVT